MEEEKEYRHSCRYCEKKFMCGRALGGHMRSHMTMPWNEPDDSYQKMKRDDRASEEMCGVEGHHQGGYDLRENPKKSLRFSDSVTLVAKDAKVCKECGKGFSSLKALFGHMKCHSEKGALDEGSCSEVHNALDRQSDSEGVPKRRSKRKVRRAALSSVSGFLSADTSFVCDIEQEQEDVAISLMMLSRDISGFRNSCASKENFLETSDNSSVSKTFRSRLERRVDTNNKKSIDFVDDGSVRKPFKPRNSLFRVGFDASADTGRKRIASNKRKKAKFGVNGGKRTVLSVTESNKESQYECEKTDCEVSDSELEKGSPKVAGFDISGPDFGRKAQKRARTDSYDSGCCAKLSSKEVGYECTNCKRVFLSYQALGGHRASHKRVKGCYARIDESENNSTETDVLTDQDNPNVAEDELKYFETENPIESEIAGDTEVDYVVLKKGKAHECPLCFKVFNSGQALGGHKRSHVLNGNSVNRGDHPNTIVIQQQMPVSGDFLDLNLPAPNEDEDDYGYSGFNSCWTNSGQKQNALEKQRAAQLDSMDAIGSSKRSGFHNISSCPAPCLEV